VIIFRVIDPMDAAVRLARIDEIVDFRE